MAPRLEAKPGQKPPYQAAVHILRSIIATENKDLAIKSHCIVPSHHLRMLSQVGPHKRRAGKLPELLAGGFSGDILPTSSQRCSFQKLTNNSRCLLVTHAVI